MITIEEFKKLQKLAKIDFSDIEKPIVVEKLNKIISMIDEIESIDCSDIEPMRSVSNMNQRVREDKVTVPNIANELFENITTKQLDFAKKNQCFIVPKVIE